MIRLRWIGPVAATVALVWSAPPQLTAPLHAQGAAPAGYYTEGQAVRGRAAFNRYCAMCHTVDSRTAAEQTKTGRGIRISAASQDGVLMDLGGKYLMRTHNGSPDYPSVYYLFNRIREAMPAFGADLIGVDTKIDIVAYILQANGLPPGAVELRPDVPALKRMPINPPKAPDEAGFESIFNGRDFSGWKFVMGPNCKPAPAGCGKDDPLGVFRVEDGVLVNTGKIQGYMYSEKKYLNFTWRFDYRFQPPADWDDSDGVHFYGNSGYFLFINDHHVWPKGIQIEGYHRNPLLPFPMSTRFPVKTEPGALQQAMRPLGAWNSVEIQSRNNVITCTLNGVLLYTVPEHEFKEAGHIGFESEGSEIHWRNIRIRVD